MRPIAAVLNFASDARGLLGRVAVAALACAFFALQLRLWTGEGSLAEVTVLETRVQADLRENTRLAEQNRLLEAEVRALKEDPDSLEARARSELGMIREGETFYVVLPAARGGLGAP